MNDTRYPELHAQQLRNSEKLHDTAPAYAYAYASVSRKEPVRREEQRLGRGDWDTLLEERIGIMLDSGISLGRARALATHDTTLRHGPRPSPEAM